MKNDKQLLNEAFRNLRNLNYYAKQRHFCCQSCGWNAVPEDKKDKVVFYHKQDADAIKDGKIGEHGLYLAWAGNGKEIIGAIEKTGLKVNWNGSEDKRICVLSQNSIIAKKHPKMIW